MTDTLAETIKSIRLEAGDSPATAAKKIGISRQGYMKWEQGDTKNMKLGNLTSFCETYNVGIDKLILGSIVFDAPIKTITDLPQAISRVNRVQTTEDAYSTKRPTTVLTAAEPDPNIKLLIDGYNAANSGMRQALLTLAKEALFAFEKRSEKND